MPKTKLYKKPFFTYFKNKALQVTMSLTLFAGIALFTISMGDIYVASEIQNRIERGSLINLMRTLKVDRKKLSRVLKTKGVNSFKSSDSLHDLSTKYDFETHEVFEELFN